jgi:hypothetical protein
MNTDKKLETPAETTDDVVVTTEKEKKAGDLEIEVVDPRPPQDRREPLKDQDKVGADKEIDAELESLKDRGAKRIQELKHQIHDQRRLKESAEREREAAVRYAASMREQYVLLQKQAAVSEQMAVEQAKARAKAEAEAAKRDYKTAYEMGDAEKVADATSRMAKAGAEEANYQAYQPRPVEEPPQHDPRKAIPDQRYNEWTRKNTWFGMQNGRPVNDESAVAYAKHLQLIGKHGDDFPLRDPDGYYKEIDRHMAASFPDKFDTEDDEPKVEKSRRERQPPAQIVAGASRSTDGRPRKVTLTQDQVAIAKRLNIPLEEYAREVLNLEQS